MDCRVAYPLKLIARMYRIERLADARELSVDERTLLRKERTGPVLDKLKRWFVITNKSEPPSAELAKATGYAINQWTALTRFVDDGRLSLDNNLCEQQMRAIALGRRNYLFCGSHDAARCTAILYGLMRTCAQYDVPPCRTSRTCYASSQTDGHKNASSSFFPTAGNPDRLPHKQPSRPVFYASFGHG